jgi:hypothetical protein
MSHPHDDAPSSHDRAAISDGIHPETAPFEPGYQPETLPKISMPDLPPDAQGLTAEALAQVPTLTDWVEEAPTEPVPEVPTEQADVAVTPEAPSAVPSPEPEVPAQDKPIEADTWGEELQVRMGKLTDDIHTLNARLDRLEERNKTKA